MDGEQSKLFGERGRKEKIEGMINDGFDAHQGNQSFRICASVPSFVSASRPRAPIRATCHGYFRPFPRHPIPSSNASEKIDFEISTRSFVNIFGNIFQLIKRKHQVIC